MFTELILWCVSCFFSVGILGIQSALKRRAASRPWNLRTDRNRKPRISILVPTYNESSSMPFKLQNLSILEYPKDLTQIVIVDSKSDDGTMRIVDDFIKMHPELKFKVLEEVERKGKSAALNIALDHCDGEIIIVSDADCFWPPDILAKTLPFLADTEIGAVSGPKILLNSESTRVTRDESRYLDSMNLIKLGESKTGSTLLFEGGFSAYKKEVLDSFDPYHTGSDDSGTVISLVEKKFRAILVPEARFYTIFPDSWTEKLSMKTRRASQLVRLFWEYLVLLSNRRIRNNRRTVAVNVWVYLFSPLFFILFVAFTLLLFVGYPWLILLLLLFVVPKLGSLLAEIFQGFFVLFLGLLAAASGRSFLVWKKPADRQLLTKDMLKRFSLI